MKIFNFFLKSNIGFFIIIAAIVFIIYGKTINYEFTDGDDVNLISKNINFISETKNIPYFFLTSCYYQNDFPYYRPILTLSFSIESIIFGLNTKVYHLSNMLLFTVSIFLIYFFLKQIVQNPTILKFSCLLISVHPIFSSTVAWIPARNDTLLLIFMCLSLINLIVYIRSNNKTNLLLLSIFFTITLFTKETSLMLIPTYILVITILELKITKQQIIKLTIVLLPIMIFYFYLRNIAIVNNPITISELNFYLSNTFIGTTSYIYKFLIPDHIPLMLYDLNFNIRIIILNIALLIFLFTSFNKKLITIKTILFGFIWFILWLFPTFLMNDYILLFHRLLIPIIGMLLVFCEFINNLMFKYPVSKKYFIIVFIILFCTYSYASYIQADKYKDSDTYWINSYFDAPNCHATCYFISRIYMKNNDYNKAKEFLYKAIKYSNNSPLYSSDLGLIYAYEGNYEDAKKEYLKSIEANINVAYSCRNLSGIYLCQNDMKNAYFYAKKAFDLEPYNIDFSIYMAKIYKLSKEYKEAVDIYLILLKHDKKNLQYYYNISELYELMNDSQNALKYIEEGLKLSPENVQLIEKAESLNKIKNDSI